MSASDQLVRIGKGAKLHLLRTYSSHHPERGKPGIHGRAACGTRGRVTPRWILPTAVLEALDPCPRCTEVARQCAGLLAHHRRIFGDAP